MEGEIPPIKRKQMQLKNNQKCNVQLYFLRTPKEMVEVNGKLVERDGKVVTDYVHIPGGATVEIEDKIYEALLKSNTRVEELEEVREVVECEVPVTMDKKPVELTEFHQTGRYRTINLFKEDIKKGLYTIVERVRVNMAEIDSVLVEHHVNIADLEDEEKLALYDKLV